jgi:hypothetical protein
MERWHGAHAAEPAASAGEHPAIATRKDKGARRNTSPHCKERITRSLLFVDFDARDAAAQSIDTVARIVLPSSEITVWRVLICLPPLVQTEFETFSLTRVMVSASQGESSIRAAPPFSGRLYRMDMGLPLAVVPVTVIMARSPIPFFMTSL